jgi:hypothetical protein
MLMETGAKLMLNRSRQTIQAVLMMTIDSLSREAMPTGLPTPAKI